MGSYIKQYRHGALVSLGKGEIGYEYMYENSLEA